MELILGLDRTAQTTATTNCEKREKIHSEHDGKYTPCGIERNSYRAHLYPHRLLFGFSVPTHHGSPGGRPPHVYASSMHFLLFLVGLRIQKTGAVCSVQSFRIVGLLYILGLSCCTVAVLLVAAVITRRLTDAGATGETGVGA